MNRNRWIEFLKKNGGQQKTRAQLSRQYRRENRTCCKPKNSRAIAKYSASVARKSTAPVAHKSKKSSRSVALHFAKAARKSLSQDEKTRHDARHHWGFSKDLYRLPESKGGDMGEVVGDHVKMSISGDSYGNGEIGGILTCEVTRGTFSVGSGRGGVLNDELETLDHSSETFKTLDIDKVASFVAGELDKFVRI